MEKLNHGCIHSQSLITPREQKSSQCEVMYRSSFFYILFSFLFAIVSLLSGIIAFYHNSSVFMSIILFCIRRRRVFPKTESGEPIL